MTKKNLTKSITLAAKTKAYDAKVDRLAHELLGPGRFVRAAERLRETNTEHRAAGRVALAGQNNIVGAVSFWPILIGDVEAWLLGPLLVSNKFAGQGIGRALVAEGLRYLPSSPANPVLLVGDIPYYEPLGFQQLGLQALNVEMPAPVARERLLVHLPKGFAVDSLSGRVRVRP